MSKDLEKAIDAYWREYYTKRCSQPRCGSTKVVWHSKDDGGGCVGTPDYYWCEKHRPDPWAFDNIYKYPSGERTKG